MITIQFQLAVEIQQESAHFPAESEIDYYPEIFN
jgi:hypothetical protein